MAYIIETPVISWIDYPDDESVAIVWYFTGCGHNCPNCHNADLQLVKAPGSIEFTLEKFWAATEYYCKKNKTNKVVLEGGDPLFPANIEFTKDILNSNRVYDICVYTGYDIVETIEKGIKNYSFIKTGKYVEQLKQTSEKTNEFMSFASTNQTLFDKDLRQLSKNGKYYWRNYV